MRTLIQDLLDASEPQPVKGIIDVLLENHPEVAPFLSSQPGQKNYITSEKLSDIAKEYGYEMSASTVRSWRRAFAKIRVT